LRFFPHYEWSLTCTGHRRESLGLLPLLLLLLAQRITNDCGVLSAGHLHQLTVTAEFRCPAAARRVDDVIALRQKLCEKNPNNSNQIESKLSLLFAIEGEF